jgi:hypothetical protein
MQHKMIVACTSAVVLAIAIACSQNSDSPVSPTGSQPSVSEAGPSGETLKATAPTPQSPVNNQQPDSLVLVAGKSTSPYNPGTAAAYSYQFEILRNNSPVAGCTQTVGGGSGSTVSYTPNCSLEFDQQYTWRVRAVFQGATGPWSATATFRAPAGGFIRDTGVFDPLTNGKTVGEIVGPVTFIPGVGAKLEDFGSHISYRLPQTLVNGEFSLIITGMASNTEGDKTKVMACSEGLADIVTNDRRMTVEKRGDPPGIVAWRLISHLDQVDTEGAEREFVEFDENQKYLFKATWNGFFNVSIQRGGSTGPTIYSKGKHYEGPYDPDPMYCFAGSPSGRSGITAASVPGMIVRNVWISVNPRPAGLD